MDIMSLTAVELGKKIKAGEISVVEATKACISNIKQYDKEYNCFITIDEEGALRQAEEIQKKDRRWKFDRTACRRTNCN